MGRVSCLFALLLAGCASPWVPQSETFGKISGELKAAGPRRDAGNEAINEALLPPMQIEAPRSAKSPEPRFDLSVNAAPAAQVFMAIVAGTRYSMLLPPDLAGNVTVNLKDVTIREALDTLRDVYGYDYKVQGTRITVFANTMQTRLFQVSYLSGKRGGTSATRVSSSGSASGSSGSTGNNQQPAAASGSGSIEGANVFTGVVSDFWFDLSQALATVLNCDADAAATPQANAALPSAGNQAAQMLSQRPGRVKCPEGKSFLLNSQSGVVMVRAMPTELREVERMLKAMQANIERQVMLEAKIIDVQLNDQFQSGINWAALDKYGGHRWSMNGNTDNYSFPGGQPPVVRDETTGSVLYSAATLTGTSGIMKAFPVVGGALGLAFQTKSFASLISFLQTQGTVYVMSSPRIATLNNQKAVIKVGSDDYFITSIEPPTSNSTGTTTNYTPPKIIAQPFFSGISLDVTPQIDEQGIITLHIRPSITDVTEREKVIQFGTAGGEFKVPYASTKVKESDSIVRVRDGMIVAIGGMMSEGQSDTVNKVPGMGDVPAVGNLFKQTGRAMTKRELVILVKPTLIQEDNDWQSDIDSTSDRLQQYDPARYKQVPDVFKR